MPHIRLKPLKRTLAALLIAAAAGFLVTRSFFLTGAVLPAVRYLTGVELYIGKIDWRPWSGRITVQDFRLGRREDTFLQIKRAQGYYNLREGLQGIISFSRLDAAGVDLHFVCDLDGVWNYFKLLNYDFDPYEEDAEYVPGNSSAAIEPPGAPEWLRFNLNCMTVRDSKLSLTVRTKNGEQHCSWSKLNIGADCFRNGASMHLLANGELDFRSERRLSLTSFGELSAQVEWGETILPDMLNMHLRLDSMQGDLGNGQPMDGSTLTVALNSSYKDSAFTVPMMRIDQTRLNERRSILRGSGRWNVDSGAFLLDLRQAELAPEPLALIFDLCWGINPGILNFYGRGHLEQDGKNLTSSGTWQLRRKPGKALFGREELILPGFSLDADQDFAVLDAPRRIDFRRFHIALSENGRPAMELKLRNPVKYQVESEFFEGKQPGIDLNVTSFSPELLRILLPELPVLPELRFSGGTVSGHAGLDFASRADDNKLSGHFDFSGSTFSCGSARMEKLDSALAFNAAITRERDVKLERLTLKTVCNGTDFISMSASGEYKHDQKSTGLKLKIEPAALRSAFFDLIPYAGIIRQYIPDCSAGAESAVRITPDTLTLNNTVLHITGPERKNILLNIGEQTIDLSTGTPEGYWTGALKSTLPAAMLNSPHVSFESGILELETGIRAAYNMKDLTLDGSFHLKNTSLRWQDFLFKELDFKQKFSLFMPDSAQIRLNSGEGLLKSAGHPALQFSCRGVCLTGTGDSEISMQIHYAGEPAVNLFLPETFARMSASGSLYWNCYQGTSRWHLQLDADKLRRSGNPDEFAATLRADCRHEKGEWHIEDMHCRLSEKNLPVADLDIKGSLGSAASRNIVLALKSNLINVTDTVRLWSSSGREVVPPAERESGEAAPEKTENGTEEKDGGNPDFILDMHLDKLVFSPELAGALHGTLDFRKGYAASQNLDLTLNGSHIPISFFRSGRKWGTSGELKGTLEIGPVIALFVPEYNAQGMLEKFKWNLITDDISELDAADDFSGHLEGAVSNLVVESRTAGDPVARLLWLPVEALFRFNAMIPSTVNLRKQWQLLQENVLTGDNPLNRFRFDTGDFELQAEKGVVKIKRLCFAGPIISELVFDGQMMLSGNMPLDMNSRIRVSGIAVNMPISGSLYRPDINLSSLDLAPAGISLNNIIEKVYSSIASMEQNDGSERSLWRQIRSLRGQDDSITMEKEQQQ